MNPQLYQSIKLMELPIVNLRERIQEELERNPALEVLEDKTLVSLDSVPVKEENDYFESASDSGFIKKGGEEASEEKQRFLEGLPGHSETLQDHLLSQLHLEPVDGEGRHICELLIQNLDEDGFNKEPLDVLLSGKDPDKIREALKIVQALDPAGTCAGGYLESLKVQVGLLPDAPKGITEALSYLKLLERGKIAEAAKHLGLTKEETIMVFNRIKELNPFPGRRFFSGETRYIVPDIQVVKKEGEFIIVLNEEEIPVLGINPFFMELAGESTAPVSGGVLRGGNKDSRPVRDFARENIKEARWFINSINQRNHTLLKVTRAIVEYQRMFFTNGPKYLTPLTLKDLAAEIGVHEATVSRTANGKYMQTDWGIFKLRYFFTNSISGTGSGGSSFSKEGVKEIIREIIMEEKRHLSDQDISAILEKRGISIARRTVAKYRNENALGVSFKR